MNNRVIYKYRNWKDDNHKNVLKKGEIYMASPKSFNDPFDCRIPENLSLIDSKDKRENFANHYIKKHQEEIVELGYDLNQVKRKVKNRLKFNLIEEQRINDEQELVLLDKYYGVFSASRTWSSILMWSHYGDNHRGYCVGFNEEMLVKSNKFGRCGDVFYSQNFPLRDPLEFDNDIVKDSFIQMHTKAIEWKYEMEYRLSILNPNGLLKSERIITLDESYISEIILGVSMDEENKEEIISICQDKNIKVFQATKVPFKFEITRNQIK
jgi:hypothetical protein